MPVRKAMVRGYPYRVIFLELAHELRVLAVTHPAREPYWLGRA